MVGSWRARLSASRISSGVSGSKGRGVLAWPVSAGARRGNHKLATPADLQAHLARLGAKGLTTEPLGRWAVARMLEGQRRVLADYGVEFDVWTSEQRDVRDRELPARMLDELTARGLTYESDGALWFRSTQVGDQAAA